MCSSKWHCVLKKTHPSYLFVVLLCSLTLAVWYVFNLRYVIPNYRSDCWTSSEDCQVLPKFGQNQSRAPPTVNHWRCMYTGSLWCVDRARGPTGQHASQHPKVTKGTNILFSGNNFVRLIKSIQQYHSIASTSYGTCVAIEVSCVVLNVHIFYRVGMCGVRCRVLVLLACGVMFVCLSSMLSYKHNTHITHLTHTHAPRIYNTNNTHHIHNTHTHTYTTYNFCIHAHMPTCTQTTQHIPTYHTQTRAFIS